MTAITSDDLKVPSLRLFVVSAPEDESFVEGFLLPSLGLPENEVLRSTLLEPGAPIVEEIARGALSLVTVLVMSPSFLSHPWTQFAQQLAMHRSTEEGNSSSTVVPALIADCETPLLARFKVPLDFRKQERWEAEAGRLRALLAAPTPVSKVVRCPYPGMRAFEEQDCANFHGREPEVSQALTYLEAGHRELYVIGSSGSGKSSLVAAGVLPKLQHAADQGGTRYLVRTMRPGADPLAALTSVFGVAAMTVEWSVAARELLARNAGYQRVLLVVDQLEELFTTSAVAARAAFELALIQLREEERCATLLTLRADFYGELINSALWEGSDRTPMRLDVKPLRGKPLRDSFEKPACGLGVYLEPALVERLVQDVKNEVGALPLLQDTLCQLWRDRTRAILRLADYEGEETGGPTGLAVRVRHRADAALHELTLARQKLARRVLLRLVQFREGEDVVTRRQQTRAALSAAGDIDGEVDAVIRHLADRRLVTTHEGDARDGWAARVDLAHEVLLTAWPTLKEWIQTQREDEQRRRVLEGKADEWVRSGRGRTRLLDAEELQEVRAWLTQDAARELGASEDVLALVAASEAAEAERAAALAELERQRQQAEEERAAAERQRERTRQEREGERITARRRLVRFALVGLTMFSVVATGLGVVLWQQQQETERQLGLNLLEQGRSLLLEQAKPKLSIPPLQQAIARDIEGPVLRTVLASLRAYVWRAAFFHSGSVEFAVFSPDGTRVLTGGEDHTARVWDVETGTLVGATIVHQDEILAAAFSPDGTRVVTASQDKTARICDVATGRRVRAPFVHQDAVASAAFSPDGTRVVTASGGAAQVWEVATGQPVGPTLAHRGPVGSAAFSPDGTRVVTASWDATAQVWEAATGRPVGPALEHEGPVTSAAFSPDGARVVTTGLDATPTTRVWEVATGHLVGTPFTHQSLQMLAAFSPDGARVVTVSGDAAQVWEVSSGKPVGTSLSHRDTVNSAAFSPDGARVITASDDHTARVWETATSRAVGVSLDHQAPVRSAAFSPDGARVVTASANGTARVWDVDVGPIERRTWATDVALSPNGTRVVTVTLGGRAQVWEVATGRPAGAALEQRDYIASIAFSPDGARVVIASKAVAQVREVATGQLVGTDLKHEGEVMSAAFSPDGRRVVTTGQDNAARVWEASTGRLLGTVLKHRDSVLSGAFNSDGTRVVTASRDGTARVWDVTTGHPVGGVLQHQGSVLSAAFSPDGALVVTASTDRTACVWNVSSGRAVGAVLQHQGDVTRAAFNPNGALVVTASRDKTARVWEVASGRPVGAVLEHGNEVTRAAFSPEGSRVVTSSDDHTARVWEVATGRPVGPPLEHGGEGVVAVFSEDGTRVVTASRDGTARVWNIAETGSLAAWSEQAKSCATVPSMWTPSVRCLLSQQGRSYVDVVARAGSLTAVGDQRMFSRVWALPRAVYQQAFDLLDDAKGEGFGGRNKEALHEGITWRLAVLDLLEGRVSAARARMGMKAPITDAALFHQLGISAHQHLFNDDVALTLLRRASELSPEDPVILAALAEAYLSVGQLPEVSRTLTKVDPLRADPELRVVLAALAWAAAHLSHEPARDPARELEHAYSMLADDALLTRSWDGTWHALTHLRYNAKQTQPVLDVLKLLIQKISPRSRARLTSLLASPSSARLR